MKQLRKPQDMIMNISIVILLILLMLWSISTFIDAHLDSAIVVLNTEYAGTRIDEAKNITEVNTDGTIVVDSGETIDNISRYIRVLRGTGNYYLPDEDAAILELTDVDTGKIVGRSTILHLVVIISMLIMLVLFKQLYRNVLYAILYMAYMVYSVYELWYIQKILAGVDLMWLLLLVTEVLLYIAVCLLIKKLSERSKLKLNMKTIK